MLLEPILDRVCGVDVHRDTIVATIKGKGLPTTTRTFATFTSDIKQFRQWLFDNLITHVAMESTGIYWKPIFNILGDEFQLVLVNAKHIKHVPGRKTDVNDSEWLCNLLINGLLSGSFIPPERIGELRDMNRYKRKLIKQISSEKNRLHKILQEGNIKLSSVVSDIDGQSSKMMIDAIIKGECNLETLADMCQGSLKKKRTEIKKALEGTLKPHQIELLRIISENIRHISKQVQRIDKSINNIIKDFKTEYKLLQTIPGVGHEGAIGIISEIGTDMDIFPNEFCLSSWAGLCPGNNESAGKKKSSRIRDGDKHIKELLVECSWSASKMSGTYLKSKYTSLALRRGKKKAIVAIAHKILVSAYYILKNKEPYKELGESYLAERRKESRKSNYIKKLKELGFEVIIKETSE
jgi:transposase